MYLVNCLLARHDVVGMAIESPRPALTAEEKLERRRRLFQKHGFIRTANKLIWNWFRSRYLAAAEAAVVREAFFPNGGDIAYQRAVTTQIVANINDAACMEFIRRLSPDLLAVCGTTVIKPELFALAPLGAVNIHTGITPEYRSADPIFWALYSGEPEKVGVTIHFIDKGIDTGPILQQEHIPVYSTDSMATIYVRCIRRGAELYLQTLSEVAAASARTIERPGVTGKAFYSISLGIFQYLVFLRRFRRLKRALRRAEQRDGTAPAGNRP